MKWILIGLFIFSSAVGVGIYFLKKPRALADAPEVHWNHLAELDYMTGVYSDRLKELDNTRVRIPRFIVPLEDNQRRVTEFLLVPSPQACIHVPAPPPNQMVYVKFQGGAHTAFGPIWVYGKLKISTKGSQYGDSSFQLEADLITPYE